MNINIIYGDITEQKCDVLVNASNGIGYMGGFLSRFIKFNGISESINYKTKGIIEKEAKKKCKRNKFIPRIIYGYRPSDVFVTSGGGLNVKYIIHAVTMRYPGTYTNFKTIQKLLPKIIETSINLGAKSIAIPLLGTGVGHLKEETVLKLYKEYFSSIKDKDLEISIVKYKKKK